MNNQQEKTALSGEEKRELKKRAHHLKPVVQLGKNRVSDALIGEIANALEAHELIKIQVASLQKASLEEDLEEILRKTSALHIETIGNIIVLFKAREKTKD